MNLTRTATGYATPDGRWTITPVNVGDSPRNKGHREWLVEDTTGQTRLGVGGPRTIVHALYAARDLIAAHTETAQVQ